MSIPSGLNRASAASSKSRQLFHGPGSFEPSAMMTASSSSPRSSAMIFHPSDRLAVFIDGANLHSTTRALNAELDFRRWLEWFRARSRLVRALYYTAVVEGEEFSPVRPLIDWLAYNGFSVVTKPARRITDADGQRRLKGNMDLEMAVDMLELAPQLDHLVLVSGDGDFRRVIEAVQSKGVKVSVISSLKTQPPHAADDLRRQADAFLDLADLLPEIGRERG